MESDHFEIDSLIERQSKRIQDLQNEITKLSEQIFKADGLYHAALDVRDYMINNSRPCFLINYLSAQLEMYEKYTKGTK